MLKMRMPAAVNAAVPRRVIGVSFVLQLPAEVQRLNKTLGCSMVNVILKCSDSIATVLPAIEQAMHTGDVCRIHNINYLGHIQTAALALLAKSKNLLDAGSGQVVESKPGFCLLAVDEYGVTRILGA